MGLLWTLITAVIGGLVIGFIAKAVLPGRQNISFLMTIVIGIVGSLAGSFIYTAVTGNTDTKGIDWIALILGVVVAAVLMVIYERVVAKRPAT